VRFKNISPYTAIMGIFWFLIEREWDRK